MAHSWIHAVRTNSNNTYAACSFDAYACVRSLCQSSFFSNFNNDDINCTDSDWRRNALWQIGQNAPSSRQIVVIHEMQSVVCNQESFIIQGRVLYVATTAAVAAVNPMGNVSRKVDVVIEYNFVTKFQENGAPSERTNERLYTPHSHSSDDLEEWFCGNDNGNRGSSNTEPATHANIEFPKWFCWP